MNAAQRRRHAWTWLVLGPLLVVVVAVLIMVRPGPAGIPAKEPKAGATP